MPRNTAAYLADIVDACDAVAEVLSGVDLETYCSRRSIRSSVEREFTIIGEAIGVLSRRDPALAARISRARLTPASATVSCTSTRRSTARPSTRLPSTTLRSCGPIARHSTTRWETQTNKRIKLMRRGQAALWERSAHSLCAVRYARECRVCVNPHGSRSLTTVGGVKLHWDVA